MAKWKKVIADHHAWAHPPDDGYDLITQPPASQQQLDDLASRLGITLPKELVSLYLTYNGFGSRSRDSSHTYWFLVPVQSAPQFTKQIRSWFRDTHSHVATRFYSFFDWANGDGMGYLFDADGTQCEGLYSFCHEEYERDEDQDVDDFLRHMGVGIEQFLSLR